MGIGALNSWIYYWLSVVILTALLFFPASKMIWVLSVRRLERRRRETLSDEQRLGQLARARFIALIVGFIFALLFNYSLLGMSRFA